MRTGNVENFICFRADSGKGGVIAEKIYDTLYNKYGRECYFSSAEERGYGRNYREEEIAALRTAERFIIILTDGFIENLGDGDEVLFELKYALGRSGMDIIAVADISFSWTEERKSILKRYFSAADSSRLIYLDYIKYIGVRDYALLTEKALLRAVGLENARNVTPNADELISKIVEAQKNDLVRMRRSGVVNMRLAEYSGEYAEPRLRVNGADCEGSFFDLVRGALEGDAETNIFVTGPSGSGKSTLTENAYMKAADYIRKKGLEIVPLYIGMNSAEDIPVSRRAALERVLDYTGLECAPDIAEAVAERYRFLIFYDALDEKSDALSVEDMCRAMASARDSDVRVFSCRTNFFKNLTSVPIDTHAEILPFDRETIASRCRRILSERHFDVEETEAVCRFAADFKPFGNALLLTFFLIFAGDNGFDDSLHTEADVMELIISNILRREKGKRKISLAVDEATEILKETAFITYRFRSAGRRPKYAELDRELKARFTGYDPADVRNTAETLLAVDEFGGVYRFTHEMFAEYLLALRFQDRLYGNEDVSEMTAAAFSPETNEFITSFFRERGAVVALERLIEAYRATDKTNYFSLLQILNHMHRTMEYGRIKTFARAELENCSDDVVKILLLHTLLAVGDEEDEEYYYECLKDERFAALNGGITLLYYGGAAGSRTLPYYDDGTLPWKAIFTGYKKHIELSGKVPHYRRVLRINMVTARNLIEKRGKCDPEIAEYYLSIADKIKNDPSPAGKKTAAAYDELVETIKKYCDV